VEIARILRDEFGLTPYLAFKTQSLSDIMTITEELRSSDYYLFVDFVRRAPADLSCSLFTHQELALAHHLGFRDMIALQESGAQMEGFIRYVLSNPAVFSTEEELYAELRRLVRERRWSADYSRNLVVEPCEEVWTGGYGDHTGAHTMNVWSVRILNRRPDAAAVKAVCILDFIENALGQSVGNVDRSNLKWSGQLAYEQTILPQDFGIVNVLSVHEDEPGIYLLSARDAHPRLPILVKGGEYRLHFKVFSEGFPLLRFVTPLTVREGVRWDMQVETFGPPV
jgi:hypothetical protein